MVLLWHWRHCRLSPADGSIQCTVSKYKWNTGWCHLIANSEYSTCLSVFWRNKRDGGNSCGGRERGGSQDITHGLCPCRLDSQQLTHMHILCTYTCNRGTHRHHHPNRGIIYTDVGTVLKWKRAPCPFPCYIWWSFILFPLRTLAVSKKMASGQSQRTVQWVTCECLPAPCASPLF